MDSGVRLGSGGGGEVKRKWDLFVWNSEGRLRQKIKSGG